MEQPDDRHQAASDLTYRWKNVRLIEPTTSGFVHVGASTGPWPLPLPLPRLIRRRTLALAHEAARDLTADHRVKGAHVFKAIVRPPGQRGLQHGADIPDADFDVILLLETKTVADAEALIGEPTLTEFQKKLSASVPRTLTFVASNAMRIGPVDYRSKGVFLFNYLSVKDSQVALQAWRDSAGWFQNETGLDNATVLVPVSPESIPYPVINHCRWDHLIDFMPSVIFKKSFQNFVLHTFREAGVTERPIVYRIDRLHTATP